jgi:beta-D-xylosidase 4
MRLSQSGFGLAAAVSGVQAPFTLPNCVDGKLASNKVCDTSLPRAERAAALVQAMTIDEKLANLKKYIPASENRVLMRLMTVEPC